MADHKHKQREQTTETHDVSEWYERCIEHLLRQSGLAVQREPRINGMTPDMLINQQDGPDVVIECLVKLKDPAHNTELMERGVHSCGGDVRESHSAIYSRVEEKAAKYRKVADGMPYVIALYNDECMNFLDTAFALAFSAHVPYIRISPDGKVVGRGYSDLWSTPERSAGLFKLYPNLSGLIYSQWERKHYFLPNPFANMPVSADLFPFACVPDAPIVDGEPAWEKRAPLFDDDYALPPNSCWGQVERLAQAIKKLIDHRLK